MSKSVNPLTNYFKRKEIVDVEVEEIDEVNMNAELSENDENEVPAAKRVKLNESADSTNTTVNPISTTNTSSADCVTTESNSTPSLNVRDHCHGPARAKEYLFSGPFQPQTKFPTVNNRHFRTEWFTTYPWLEYSLRMDRAFCFPCRLRNDSRYESAFTISGFCQWKNGTSRFNNHQAAQFHKEAFERWKTTIQNHDNNTDVLKSLDQQHSKHALENRTYLRELIRTIHFLARQGISCVVTEKVKNLVTKAISWN